MKKRRCIFIAAILAAGIVMLCQAPVAVRAAEEGGAAQAAQSADNSLSSLSISPGKLSPEFYYSTTSYTATVASDVDSVTVSATPSNANAVVESVTGNEGLSEGANTIRIVVRAENGATATYSIQVTRQAAGAGAVDGQEQGDGGQEQGGDDAQGAGSDGQGGDDGDGQEQGNDGQGDGNDAQEAGDDGQGGDGGQTGDDGQEQGGAPLAPGEASIDGISYLIDEDFSEEELPEGFSTSTVSYNGAEYRGASMADGQLKILYLAPSDGDGSRTAYVCDEARGWILPFVRMQSGEHFVVAGFPPEDVPLPDGYASADFTIGDGGRVTAYQGAAEAGTDFYVFYGYSDTGNAGWYRYDALEGTYQRTDPAAAIAEEEEFEETDAPAEDEGDNLAEQNANAQAKLRSWLAIAIFVIAVLLIVILNLVVGRFSKGDEFPEDEEPGDDEPAPAPRHTRRTREDDGLEEESAPAPRHARRARNDDDLEDEPSPAPRHTRRAREDDALDDEPSPTPRHARRTRNDDALDDEPSPAPRHTRRARNDDALDDEPAPAPQSGGEDGDRGGGDAAGGSGLEILDLNE